MHQLTSLFCGILIHLVNFWRLGIIFWEIGSFCSKAILELDILEGVAPRGSPEGVVPMEVDKEIFALATEATQAPLELTTT